MENKKKIIIFGGAALALVVAASVIVTFIHKDSQEQAALDTEETGEVVEISYTNDSHEVENVSDIEVENDEKTKELEIDQRLRKEKEEKLAKLEEEYKKSLPDYIVSGDSSNQEAEGQLQIVVDDTEGDNTEENDSAETDNDDDLFELRMPVHETTGYYTNEVLCDVQSKEDAESIAYQISGTLLSWENGVAKIQIEESVDDLLERLEQQGSSLELYRSYYF